jgi:hypothetical protein
MYTRGVTCVNYELFSCDLSDVFILANGRCLDILFTAPGYYGDVILIQDAVLHMPCLTLALKGNEQAHNQIII